MIEGITRNGSYLQNCRGQKYKQIMTRHNNKREAVSCALTEDTWEVMELMPRMCKAQKSIPGV